MTKPVRKVHNHEFFDVRGCLLLGYPTNSGHRETLPFAAMANLFWIDR